MNDRNFATTLAKGLNVLSCFEAQPTGLAMPDIVGRTGYDRATVRRLCLTLEREGYLERDARGLRLASRVLALTGGYLASLDVGRRVQPVLREAAEALDMEVSLATLDQLQAIYVDRAAPVSARVTLGLSVGSRLPLLHTAVGRMLLARSPSDTLDRALKNLAPRGHTEHSQTDPDQLRNEVEDARRQGFCFAHDEFELGAAGLAVPVGALGDTPFVVACTASTNRLGEATRREEVLDVLRQATLSIGRIAPQSP